MFLTVPANSLVHLFTEDCIRSLHLLCAVYACAASDTEVRSECVSERGRRGPWLYRSCSAEEGEANNRVKNAWMDAPEEQDRMWWEGVRETGLPYGSGLRRPFWGVAIELGWDEKAPKSHMVQAVVKIIQVLVEGGEEVKELERMWRLF